MTIKFNVPGRKRKELAKCIGIWLGCEVSYAGAPSFAYQVGNCTIDRNGSLTCDLDSETAERLLQHLYDESFSFEMPTVSVEDDSDTDCVVENEAEGTISVRIPLSTMDETATANLRSLLEAKGKLIRAALGGSETLPVRWNDNGCIDFPWLPDSTDPFTANAWMKFISALCEMARNAKRVTAKEKESDNQRYDFRCFLLRLGFIGETYKEDRKILLKNLSGSSAFKGGVRNVISS